MKTHQGCGGLECKVGSSERIMEVESKIKDICDNLAHDNEVLKMGLIPASIARCYVLSIEKKLAELEGLVANMTEPGLRVMAFSALNRDDDILDECTELSTLDKDEAFELANGYTQSDNPRLRRAGLIKLAEIGEERCFEPLKEHFVELLEGDTLAPYDMRSVGLRIESPLTYQGVATTLARINPREAFNFLHEELCKEISEPTAKDCLDRYWKGWDRVAETLVDLGGAKAVGIILSYQNRRQQFYFLNGLENRIQPIRGYLGSINYRDARKGQPNYSGVLNALTTLGHYAMWSLWGDETNEMLVELMSHEDRTIRIDAAAQLMGHRFYGDTINCSPYHSDLRVGRESAATVVDFYIKAKNHEPETAKRLLKRIPNIFAFGQLGTDNSKELLMDAYNGRNKIAGMALGYSNRRIWFHNLLKKKD